MITLRSTANVFPSTCIVHADFYSRANVHRPPKWICKQSTAILLDGMMSNLVWEHFDVLQMFSNLIASCMLIFKVVHTCTDPQNEFASKILLTYKTELCEIWYDNTLKNVFRSTCIVHADFHSRAYVHRPPKWICKQGTANLLDEMIWN